MAAARVTPPRKQPARLCRICRHRFAKNELLRWVVTADGELETDENQKKPGRGIYTCSDSCKQTLLEGTNQKV